MSNVAVVTLAWTGVLLHVLVAIAARRRLTSVPLVPLLNLVAMLLALAYWVQRWYGYLVRGITWYATDGLPLVYALVVCVLAARASWTRSVGIAQWAFFTIDGVVLLAAALLFSVLRFDRMI